MPRAGRVYHLAALAQPAFCLPEQHQFRHQRETRWQLGVQVDDSAAESFWDPGP